MKRQLTADTSRPPLGGRGFRSRLKPHTGLPSLVALLDILFLILFFVILTNDYVKVSGIPVDVPQVKPKAEALLSRRVISVTPGITASSKTRIWFNEEEMDLIGLREKLASESGRMVVRFDRRVKYDAIAEVLGVLSEANTPALLMVVSPDKNNVVFENGNDKFRL